jgi:phosphatidylinositol alpha-1,6-mannosyltransferase
VFTTAHPGAAEFDAAQPFRVVRAANRVLLPRRALAARVDALARELGASVLFVDPMLPLGAMGRRLRAAPHIVVVHGAEIVVPGRVPLLRNVSRRVLLDAAGIVAAGNYVATAAAAIAGRALPTLVVPPGVDVERFRPVSAERRAAVRRGLGLAVDRPVVLGLSRLVPRKGFDVLLDAVRGLDPDVQLVIAGEGRDRGRLERRARPLGARVRFLGRVPDAALADLYRASDVFAMLCRDRWGGLEAEGFGVVFAEAGACGIPSVAGRSGGAPDAVRDGETGFVVEPRDVGGVRDALDRVLRDDGLRGRLGAAARALAVATSADAMAARLGPLAAGDLDVLVRTP